MKHINSHIVCAAILLFFAQIKTAFCQSLAWQSIGLDTSKILTVAINSRGYVFAGTDGQRNPSTGTVIKRGYLFRSQDNGRHWRQIAPDSIISGAVEVMAINPSDDEIFLAGKWGNIYRSNDQGETWIRLQFPYNPYNTYTIQDITVKSATEVWVASRRTCGWMCGTFGEIFSTTDHGATWSGRGGDGYTNNIVRLFFDSFGQIFLAGTEISIYPVPYPPAYVSRSTNGGRNWEFILDLNQKNVTDFAVNANHHLFAAADSGVFRSTNHGDSWTAINTGLTKHRTRCLAITSQENLFVGTTGGGIFQSNNNGDNWFAVNTGLTNFNINALVCDSSGYVFVGTDRGVFRSSESITSVKTTQKDIPASFKIKQNYPNPFNPTTTVEYEVEYRVAVSLNIYDALGREITQLVNAVHEPGVYQIQFDASGLASGMYYYTMKAGTFSETKQMILAR